MITARLKTYLKSLEKPLKQDVLYKGLLNNEIPIESKDDLLEVCGKLGKNYSSALLAHFGKDKSQQLLSEGGKSSFEALCGYFHPNDDHVTYTEKKASKVQYLFGYTDWIDVASPEETKKTLETPNDPGSIRADHGRNLLQFQLEALKAREPEKQIQLLDIGALHQYLQTLDSNTPRREQLIIDNNGHYTAVDILIGNGEKKCIILDAANDAKMNDTKDLLIINGFDTRLCAESSQGASGTLQRDLNSCPVFAYDHCYQLSKLGNELYADLESKCSEGKNLYFEDLPPSLVKNAQSMAFLDRYQQKNPEACAQKMPDGNTLSGYLAQNSGAVVLNGAEKIQNRSIDNLRAEIYRSASNNLNQKQTDIPEPASPVSLKEKTPEEIVPNESDNEKISEADGWIVLAKPPDTKVLEKMKLTNKAASEEDGWVILDSPADTKVKEPDQNSKLKR